MSKLKGILKYIPHIKRTGKLEHPTTAQSMGFVITFKEGHEDDVSLLAHELTHVMQWWRVFLVSVVASVFLYYTGNAEYITTLAPVGLLGHNVLTRIRAYRKYAEVEAFKNHIKHGRDFENAAYNLYKHYNLKITLEEARQLLR